VSKWINAVLYPAVTAGIWWLMYGDEPASRLDNYLVAQVMCLHAYVGYLLGARADER
jgi:hypothetical protein